MQSSTVTSLSDDSDVWENWTKHFILHYNRRAENLRTVVKKQGGSCFSARLHKSAYNFSTYAPRTRFHISCCLDGYTNLTLDVKRRGNHA